MFREHRKQGLCEICSNGQPWSWGKGNIDPVCNISKRNVSATWELFKIPISDCGSYQILNFSLFLLCLIVAFYKENCKYVYFLKYILCCGIFLKTSHFLTAARKQIRIYLELLIWRAEWWKVLCTGVIFFHFLVVPWEWTAGFSKNIGKLIECKSAWKQWESHI